MTILGVLQSDFCKNVTELYQIDSPLKVCLISQISVRSLWHVCIPYHISHYPIYQPLGNQQIRHPPKKSGLRSRKAGEPIKAKLPNSCIPSVPVVNDRKSPLLGSLIKAESELGVVTCFTQVARINKYGGRVRGLQKIFEVRISFILNDSRAVF